MAQMKEQQMGPHLDHQWVRELEILMGLLKVGDLGILKLSLLVSWMVQQMERHLDHQWVR